MSNNNWEKIFKKELAISSRHEDFLQIMNANRWVSVDWKQFWKYYYKSKLSAEEAFYQSKW